MGGGSPSDTSANQDDSWGGFSGTESPWPSLFHAPNVNLELSSRGGFTPNDGGSLFDTRDTVQSFLEPQMSRNVASEQRGDHFDSFVGRDLDEFRRCGTENLPGFGAQSRTTTFFTATDEFPGKSSQPSEKVPTTQPSQWTPRTLFKLMDIENDNQDLSFVEKVILSRDETFRLCNDISERSATVSEGRRIVDFLRLDCKSMKVIGYFGSKDIMRDILQQTECTEQGEEWRHIQNDTLAPGLYALLRPNTLFVFYWHQGHSLPEASRKDMSCNFIRYIFDLCDIVHVCVEGKTLKSSFFETAPRFSNRHRTQRLQISLVKASEDSVKVSDGFSLESLPLVTCNAPRTEGRSEKDAPSSFTICQDFKLSEGLSRVALLASSNRQRKIVSSKDKKEMRVKDFPAFIDEWIQESVYCLNLKNLTDSDFVTFIRSAKLQQADAYERLLVSHEERKTNEKNRTYTVDQLVQEEQERLSRVLESFLDVFLKYKYPSWENFVLKSTSSNFHLIAPETSSAGQSEYSGEAYDHVQIEWHGLGMEQNRNTARESLNKLEDEFYGLLLGKNSKQRLLFPFSEFFVFNTTSETYLRLKDGRRATWTMALAKSNSGNASSNLEPIFYGSTVTVMCTNGPSDVSKTGIVNRSKVGGEQCPLLTDEDMSFTFASWRSVKLEPLCRSSDLTDWVCRQTEFPNVVRQAALLTAIFKFGGSEQTIDLTKDLVRRTLASEDPLGVLRTLLPSTVLQFAAEKWKESENLDSPRKFPIAVGLIDTCVHRYKTFRSELQSRMSQTRRSTTTLLNQRIRKECSARYEGLATELKKEEAAFLASQKDSLSIKNSTSLLALTVLSCTLIKQPYYAILSKEDRISIAFVRERIENESITWHGFELAPMKDDLDQLVLDSDHTFSPSCSASKEIIDLDPSSQKLFKVVFLKAGQLLVFIIEGHTESKTLQIYLCPKLGVKIASKQLIKAIKRGFDLVAFDERSRFIALYDGSIATIKTFRFDESFNHMDWTGVDIILGEYSIGPLIWMDFVPGKSEIVFIDDFHRVRLCEVNQPGLVRAGNVHVGSTPIVKACVTTQGSCLLLLRNVKCQDRTTVVDEAEKRLEAPVSPSEEQRLIIDVYKLDDSIQQFSSIPLDMNLKDTSNLVIGLASFSSQMHLVVFDRESPSRLASKVIKISSGSEVCQLQHITRPEEGAISEKTQSGPVMDYIYQVFEKYATSPPLNEHSRDLHLRIVLEGSSATLPTTALNVKCMEFVQKSFQSLKRDKGKDFSALIINVSVHDAETYQGYKDLPESNDGGSRSASSGGLGVVTMGAWMRRLICLVPIQIARAEQNALKPLVDGLQLSGNVDYTDAISLADAIRFGLYEAVFESWTGPVKVISSMGKQSSGKSYLLNHLSGSLLDVAGGRCTDGVWMTLRQGDESLYVLLDFEGLGSFERSEQEDMLLSMLNAAISNLTIFNKKDFHLDKETEAIFQRFQNGVSLVKTDPKLFRGLFYMAIKDVDTSDVEDLKKEFFSKISQICSKSQDNFLTRMYGGAVEISAMPSFNRPEFHDSIADIARTVEEVEASYLSGRAFLLDLKLIISQITTKDWTPIDSKRMALRVNLLRKHLKSAISIGCFLSDGILKPLMQFDDNVDISDEPVMVHGVDFPIADTALELSPFREKKVTSDILFSLMSTFKTIVSRNGEKDEEWHSVFENFVSALVLRRKTRVSSWIAVNTSDFPNDGDIQKLQFEAVALLAEVQQNLLLCSLKCERCFLRCVQEKGHPSSHSCLGDHRCVAMCTFCMENESEFVAGPCDDAAGHHGPHDCKKKSHTCGKCCIFAATSSNCNGSCSNKSGHSGEHECNSRQHICSQICSLPNCNNPCASPIDTGDHEVHACHEKFCPLRCTMPGCNRTCATVDHFHGIQPGVTDHFCGAEHPCSAKCESKGNCEVLTEVSKKTQTFTGQRATFDYLLVSEQNGIRKHCCIVIPPHKETHEGPHSHTSNPDAVHFCQVRCQSCGYFCTRPTEHGGLHRTTHGNMRDVNFAAESEEIDILDRKYAWGESGVAEMCQMHCKAQGRGHTHLTYCPANNGGTCLKVFDGSQHEQRKYGPDFHVPKDEMTHAAFWEYMRFEDPCSAEEQKQFALCNHQCKSDEHTPSSGGPTSAVQNISYCTEPVWHELVRKSDLTKFGTGYITEDGHHFTCDHSTNLAVHVIFVIDRSSSMESGDIRPSMTQFSSNHNNRLGCVYEAILRFIRTRLSSVQEDLASVILFNHAAETVFSVKDMDESLVGDLLPHYPSGSTTYSSGLQHAEQILQLATKDARSSRKCPVIVFLSDGGNNGGSDPLSHIGAMKALEPKLQLHTIMFGNDPARKILEDMARAGDGTFEVSLDEVQLTRRFEGLAKSLRPPVASLL